MSNSFKRFLTSCAVLFMGIMAFAQGTTSSMTGAITDSNGDAIVGAVVVAVHTPSGSQYHGIAGNNGYYTINGMRPGGPYVVTVSTLGYKSVRFENLTLKLGETSNLDAYLEEDTQMLNEANVTVAESIKNSDALIANEEARVDEARRIAYGKIEELQNQIRSCLNALERIKENNRPAPTNAFDYDRIEGTGSQSTDAVADEISANLQALVGTAEEVAPKAEPRHPISETTTSKFANLQFGRNYDHR